MSAPKLPPGFKWDLRKSVGASGYILVLLPAEGYTWDFPLHNPSAKPTMACYSRGIQNPKDAEALHETARLLLAEVLGPTTVLKPRVRKLDV